MSNAYDVVRQFEQTIADYAGSKYAVSVESCTAAIFLSCIVQGVKGKVITMPKFSYPSVPASIIHAGGKVKFSNEKWKGIYELKPVNIIDSALRFKRGMYKKGSLYCISLHSKKLLPVGRGGVILLDDKKKYEILKLLRFDGRPEASLSAGVKMLGYNMYYEPEKAARALTLFEHIKDENLPDIDSSMQKYPDLSKYAIFTKDN